MWSLHFESEVSIYELWLEDRFEIEYDFDDKLEGLPGI
jgi:hypothetical protein